MEIIGNKSQLQFYKIIDHRHQTSEIADEEEIDFSNSENDIVLKI